MAKIIRKSKQEIDAEINNTIKEETERYENLIHKLSYYRKLTNLNGRCQFWYSNKINILATSGDSFRHIYTVGLPCYPNSEADRIYYEEWLLKEKCKKLKGSKWDITIIENGKIVEENKRKITVIPLEELIDDLRGRLINNNAKNIIENELKLQKKDLEDFLKKPYYQNIDKGIFSKLMSNQALRNFIDPNDENKSIDSIAKVWDKAKYILYLENELEKLNTGVSISISLPSNKEVIIMNPKQPLTRQKRFINLLLGNLKDGIGTTSAIQSACKSMKYSERNGLLIYKKLRNGELIHKEFSEFLKEQEISHK